MKRWLAMILVLGASVAALYYLQGRKTETHVGPEAMLNALAETQREISRLPAGVVRLSDPEEITAGDAMAKNYLARRGQLSAVDAEIENYVAEVGRTVAVHARRKFD